MVDKLTILQILHVRTLLQVADITILLFITAFTVQSQESLTVYNLDRPIVIDGYLESTWQKVDSVMNFLQLEPETGAQSTRKTVVRTAQFGDALFFSFECFMNPGDQIASRIQRRDLLNDSDDIISLLLNN
jgi:hypothetical protein